MVYNIVFDQPKVSEGPYAHVELVANIYDC